jgi:preprotein translocase subunit SecA
MKKFIGKRKQFIFDNLAQIKTGEGKSYALGILSSIFALWGFNVSCASYSEYLSKRDY